MLLLKTSCTWCNKRWLKNGFLNGGQVAGLIEDIPNVSELIEGMMRTARHQVETGIEQLNSFSSIN